jgi:hypothetical protein
MVVPRILKANRMIGGIIAALIIALSIAALSVLIFRRKGPWGTLWTFFLLVFLALWAVSIYFRDVGPVYWGVAWLPLLFSAVILAALLISIVPDANHMRDDSFKDAEPDKITFVEKIRSLSGPRSGSLFWVVVVILIVVIVVGMVNPQMAL